MFHLPPKGCLFNPVEVLNADLKNFVNKWTPQKYGRADDFPGHGIDAFAKHPYTGPQSLQEVYAAVNDFLLQGDEKLRQIVKRGYKERGSARAFKQVRLLFERLRSCPYPSHYCVCARPGALRPTMPARYTRRSGR